MLVQQRYKHILEKLEKTGSVTANDIATELSISPETVRRDLIMLETHGKLKRVFGGAVTVNVTNHFTGFESRLNQNTQLKAELSRYAVNMIDDGDVIAMEAGSTATEMAKILLETNLNITVITQSNTVFNILKNKFTVVLVGGEYYKEDDCFGGNITEEFLKRFHVNKSFVFPSALSVKNGIEGYLLPTLSISRVLAEIADKVFVLADSEKFSTRAMYKMMDLDPEFIYITDSQVKNEIKTEFAEKGLVLISEEQ